MTVRPGAKKVTLLEQIIEDPVTGITIQIESIGSELAVIRLYGELKYGNRELSFESGEFAGGGVAIGQTHPPTWIRETDISDHSQPEDGESH